MNLCSFFRRKDTSIVQFLFTLSHLILCTPYKVVGIGNAIPILHMNNLSHKGLRQLFMLT